MAMLFCNLPCKFAAKEALMKRDKLQENSQSSTARLLPRHHFVQAKEKETAKRNAKLNK